MKIERLNAVMECGKCGKKTDVEVEKKLKSHVHTALFECSNIECETKWFLHIQEVKK